MVVGVGHKYGAFNSPGLGDSANDPSFGGGNGCPPDYCKKLRDILDKSYDLVMRYQNSGDPALRALAHALGHQFRGAVKQYNKMCSPRYSKDPFVKTAPRAPKGPLEDFYLK